ncbi:MAG: hypothetical protein WD490_03375 [Opitutales bacterium]
MPTKIDAECFGATEIQGFGKPAVGRSSLVANLLRQFQLPGLFLRPEDQISLRLSQCSQSSFLPTRQPKINKQRHDSLLPFPIIVNAVLRPVSSSVLRPVSSAKRNSGTALPSGEKLFSFDFGGNRLSFSIQRHHAAVLNIEAGLKSFKTLPAALLGETQMAPD